MMLYQFSDYNSISCNTENRVWPKFCALECNCKTFLYVFGLKNQFEYFQDCWIFYDHVVNMTQIQTDIQKSFDILKSTDREINLVITRTEKVIDEYALFYD